MTKKSKAWKSYEEVATYLLNQIAEEFGLERFEGKQQIKGKRSGTDWEIDAKGVGENDQIFIIVECRRYTTSRQNQEKLGSLAYRILDTGAQGGIVVSPLGIQKGAKKIAEKENIYTVTLSRNSTPREYFLRFLQEVHIGVELPVSLGFSVSASVIRKDGELTGKGKTN
jgi:Restriction endonuclease